MQTRACIEEQDMVAAPNLDADGVTAVFVEFFSRYRKRPSRSPDLDPEFLSIAPTVSVGIQRHHTPQPATATVSTLLRQVPLSLRHSMARAYSMQHFSFMTAAPLLFFS
jgi:hypothetical protein